MSKVASQALRCTADEARAIFAAFPAKAQRSLPGHAIATVIDIIGSDRTASLQEALAQLFPDEPFDKARRRLTTEIANRVYVDDTGNAPLKIVQTRKGVEPALLWLERLNVADTRGLTDVGERYAADTFVSAEATQKTSAEIVADIAESAYTAPPESNDESPTPNNAAQQPKPNPAYNAARDHTITQLVKPHNAANDSLRGSNLAQEHFTDTEAAQADGFSAFAEPTKAEPHNTVNALEAMLAWAADSSATAPKLLALLGDYGTGKTSHALQFSRVLNSDVAHPNRPASLSALHIDLAYLRGAPGLAQLNVTQIIGLVIEARGLDKVLSPNIVVREVREGRRILVYDGLDELTQTDHAQLHSVFRQLLQVLEPDPATRDPSRARLIVSCRTHYFRDLTEQHEFFNTRLRHSVTRKDYLCLYLLPWKAATVRDYLNRRLTTTEATALSDTIATTYNLEELASRPVLLAMMCEQVGEVLRLRDAGGGAVTASTLYAQTVAMWVRRDDEKHVLQATHKPVLMGALACAMWNDGKEFWSADRLDRWLRKTVDALFPGYYSPEQTQTIQDDLRTATFIVRPREDAFTFAHRSFLEFFLARHVVNLMDWEDFQEDALRTMRALPENYLNRETLSFMDEMLRSRPDLIEKRVGRLWSWLSYQGSVEHQGNDMHEALPAPKCHPVIFRIACKLRLSAPVVSRRANLRGRTFSGVEVDGVRFPPLDLRGATFTIARFFECQMSSIWAAFANLAGATFRDCVIDEFLRTSAEVDGLLLRKMVARPDEGKPLVGPWTRPASSVHFSRAIQPFAVTEMVHADDYNVVIVSDGYRVFCWSTITGKLRWGNYSRMRSPKAELEGVWSVDLQRRRVSHLLSPQGEMELFQLDDGKHSVSINTRVGKAQGIEGFRLRRSELDRIGVAKQSIPSYQIQSGPLAGCTRYFVHGQRPSTACFDAEGRLVDYDEEAADTWLRYLGNGYPQPVEAAWLELDEFGRALGPKKG
jgi:hypothetical protein